MKHLSILLVAALVCLSVGAASAEEQPSSDPANPRDVATPVLQLPKRALVYSNLLGVRINPLGAANQFRLGWRERLSDSTSPLLAPAHITPTVTVNLSPAFAKLGAGLEISPMAALVLFAGYEFVGYFGTFQNVLSYDSVTANYADGTRSNESKSGLNYPTAGGMATLSVLLQGKVGPIAVRSQLQGFYASMKLRRGDRFYYDPWTDIAVPAEGWFMTNDADVLAFLPAGFVVGARHTVVHTLDADQKGVFNLHHRLGPLLLYQFSKADEPSSTFSKPMLIFMAQWFIQHRYRTGIDTPTALPQFVIAFAFSGTLLSLE